MIKKIILGLMALILVAVAIYKWMPVGEKVNPLVYFDEFKSNENNLVYEDVRIPLKEPVRMIENSIYVAYDFAKDYISDTIFYDGDEKILTFTNAREMLRMYPDSDSALLNFEEITVEEPIKELEGQLYIPAKLIRERYGVEVTSSKNKALFTADNLALAKERAVLKRSSSLRTHPQKRSIVLEELKKGENVIIYKEESDFIRVRSETGIVGFIPKGDIKDVQQIKAESLEEKQALPIPVPLNEKVNLVWDQMGSKTVGDWTSSKYANIEQANVISPTWFEFEDESGKLIDRGTKQYVVEAKQRNLQVWPLISHNFTTPALTKQILTSTAKRQYMIDQMIQKAEEYGYDGINVDIENIQPDISEVWVQFMRELYPQLKEAGLVVSVDVYMPSNWSGHYERKKIAQVCDYFIVMAYDQHWSGSETAGSVSELPWVEDGIQKNLEEVPKEKLVLGIPFYTRIWEEREEGLKATAYGMKPAQDMINRWEATPVLDENSGQNYVEVERNSTVYKVWIEDSMSIQKRIDLISQYDLAGYGAWKLGLETPNIWQELEAVK
jgi:spore germination protein YaaH